MSDYSSLVTPTRSSSASFTPSLPQFHCFCFHIASLYQDLSRELNLLHQKFKFLLSRILGIHYNKRNWVFVASTLGVWVASLKGQCVLEVLLTNRMQLHLVIIQGLLVTRWRYWVRSGVWQCYGWVVYCIGCIYELNDINYIAGSIFRIFSISLIIFGVLCITLKGTLTCIVGVTVPILFRFRPANILLLVVYLNFADRPWAWTLALILSWVLDLD